MNKPISTDRLILRCWEESDAEALFNICLDKELRASGINYYNNIKESKKIIKAWKRDGEKRAIIRKSDNKLIGLIALGDMNRYPQYKELEYAIAADCRKNGFATEAVTAMLDFIFTNTDTEVIAAWVRSNNTVSTRVLEKCQFVLEGKLRRHARDKSDTLCYSVLKDEYVK